MAAMKKTYYYNFMPSKQQELVASATNRPFKVTRTLVEIRDDKTPSMFEAGAWRIKKKIDTQEVATGKIHLSHDDVFECIFRYITLEKANHIVKGNRIVATVRDTTDGGNEVYGPYDDQVYFEKLDASDEYALGINMALIRKHGLTEGDQVEILYEPRSDVFFFKAFK